MNSLNNLLAHEIMDLYSAEEQIIEALPQMIEKAQNQELKRTLSEHLKITEQQKKRLDKVKKLLKESGAAIEEEGDTVCLGMQGLIEEGQKMMSEDMEPEVMDAAITAAAQKIEHYEISAYGTACAFARELKLKDVEKLLQQTLDEEYEADGLLTELAVGGLNMEAEGGEEDISVRKIPEGRKKGRTAARKTTNRSNTSGNGSAKKSAKSTRTSKSAGARKTTSRSKTAKSKKSRAR